MTVQSVLRDDVIYVTFDRFVCSRLHCAGATASMTGRTIDGHPLRAIDDADLVEWASYDLGALKCDCGRLTAGGG